MHAATIFTEYQGWATALARNEHRKLPPSFDVADLIQEAHIQLAKKAETYDPAKNDSFKGYAHLSIVGAIRMATRRRHFKNATAEALDRPEVVTAVKHQSEDLQDTAIESRRREWREARRMRLLKLKLKRLEPQVATIARLVFIEGRTIAETALTTQSEEKTVKQHLRAAVKGLRGRADQPSLGSRRLLTVLKEKAGAILTQERLAKLLDCRKSTVQRQINDLKARGLLSTRKAGKCNVYRVREIDSKMRSENKIKVVQCQEQSPVSVSAAVRLIHQIGKL